MKNLVIENKHLFTAEEFEIARLNCAEIYMSKGWYCVGSFGCPNYRCDTLDRAIGIVKEDYKCTEEELGIEDYELYYECLKNAGYEV